jgi:hypothetical protein
MILNREEERRSQLCSRPQRSARTRWCFVQIVPRAWLMEIQSGEMDLSEYVFVVIEIDELDPESHVLDRIEVEKSNGLIP